MTESFNAPNPRDSQDSDRAENAPRSSPPGDTDAVLGGHAPPLIEAAVLGGSEGIEKRWASDNLDEKIAALKEALKAGKTGLESLCKNSNDEFLLARLIASYALQHNKGDSTFEQLLQHYPLWQPVRTFIAPLPETDAYSSAGLSLMKSTISPDKGFLLCVGSTSDDNPHLPDHLRPIDNWFSYVLDLKSGKKKVHIGHISGSSLLSANLEGQVMTPQWPTHNSLYFFYGIYNWNTSKTYGLVIFSNQRKMHCSGFQKKNSPSMSWGSLKTIISPDGQTLFLTLEEKVLMIDIANEGEPRIEVNLDVESPRIRHSLTGNTNPVENLALTPDGRTLATCDCHGNFFIWDLQTLALKHSFIGNAGPVERLALSPDGRILASSFRRQIFIWDIESRTLKHTLTFPHYSLSSLRISPDGQILATGEERGKFVFWHIPSGELLDTAPGQLLSHDFQMLIWHPRDRSEYSHADPINVWEAKEFVADPQSQPTEASTDTPTQPTEASTDTPTQPTEASTDTKTQPTEASIDTQIAEEIPTNSSNALIYAQDIISEPKRNSRWVNSLATDLDEQLLGCKIVAYKIQWFSGAWTNWYVPGINDLYQKTNLGESVRRVWSHFNDHRHQYLSIPLSDKNSLRSFSEFERGLIPELAGASGVKYFEGEPTNDPRWTNTLSLDLDREITGHQIIAYQLQLPNQDWSGWLIPGYQDIYQDTQKSPHRWWAYFKDSRYRYLYME